MSKPPTKGITKSRDSKKPKVATIKPTKVFTFHKFIQDNLVFRTEKAINMKMSQ